MANKKFTNKKIKRLEDLEAWVQARKLAKMLFELSRRLSPAEKFGITAHINENARHIPANIAEGFGRFYIKDSVQFYRVALGSLNEVRSDLYLCTDRAYINQKELEASLKQVDLTEKLTIGLIASAGKVKSFR